MIQLFELLLCLSGSRRFSGGLQPVADSLIHCSVRYMQITARQEYEWMDDVTKFLDENSNDNFMHSGEEDDDDVDDCNMMSMIHEYGPMSVRSSAATFISEFLSNNNTGSNNNNNNDNNDNCLASILIRCIQQELELADKMKQVNNHTWWKKRESGLFAILYNKTVLLQKRKNGDMTASAPMFLDAELLYDTILAQDVMSPHAPELLKGIVLHAEEAS